jgi:hypothetical protein
LKQSIAKLKPDQVKPFMEEISLFGDYAHGTHVAGILTAGNPYARLVVGRITFDSKMIPDPCPSRALPGETGMRVIYSNPTAHPYTSVGVKE